MLKVSRLALSGLLLAGHVAAQVCTSNLVIDDFSNFSRAGHNLLGGWASDDNTMGQISASNGVLALSPSSPQSYYYTNIPCLDTQAAGYDAISFPIKAPAGAGGIVLELQSSSTCDTEDVKSVRVRIEGLTTNPRTVTVPLSTFTGANLAAIKAVVWSDFGAGNFEIGKLSLRCVHAGQNPSSDQQTNVPTRTDVVTPTQVDPGSGTCQSLLIDDWNSQSRLTFLNYNAMLHFSSDEGTMSSIVVSNNRVTLTPKPDISSYFYSQFGCLSATSKYGGISLRIKAPRGSTFSINLQSSSTCNATAPASNILTSAQLGWSFDGTEKLYSLSFSRFPNLDTSKITAIVFENIKEPITLGPMAFYCGNTPSEYQLPQTTTATSPTATVPLTTATGTAGFIIDRFTNQTTNDLGFYHGGDQESEYTISNNSLTIRYSDPDYAFYTQLSSTCRDISTLTNGYIVIFYSGSTQFSIALQSHNSACDPTTSPYPETWDVVHASRYAVYPSTIIIPVSHFQVPKTRIIGIALKSFTEASTSPTTISTIGFLPYIPSPIAVSIPQKIRTAPLVFACTRPNSFAFAIDDGLPGYAQEVMEVIRDENIKVTFFTVGAALRDQSTSLSAIYREAYDQGHQIALHSFSHPKLEGLKTLGEIEWEIQQGVDALREMVGVESKYFRPPFGNEGARMREALERLVPGATVVNWSVDVQDWIWGESSTPEKQVEAFRKDVEKGGNLVVLHYLYPSTVKYLREFIKIAKATGKQLMRVDQCLEDPNAPPL